jgi:hypothetical protein
MPYDHFLPRVSQPGRKINFFAGTQSLRAVAISFGVGVSMVPSNLTVRARTADKISGIDLG